VNTTRERSCHNFRHPSRRDLSRIRKSRAVQTPRRAAAVKRGSSERRSTLPSERGFSYGGGVAAPMYRARVGSEQR